MDRRAALSLGLAAAAFSKQALADTVLPGDGSVISDPKETIRLWPGIAPGGERLKLPANRVSNRDPGAAPLDRYIDQVGTPSMTVFRPLKADGSAMIIAPGGGYTREMLDFEGMDVARRFNGAGVTCFVLRYRLPGEGWANRSDVPLQDAQRAMRLIRSRSQELGFDPARVGVMGFSAGGHVAGLLATRFDKAIYTPVDAADTLSAKPTVAAMCYPVVTMMQPYAHQQSMHAALGANPTDEARQANSLELHVPPDAPPVFVCATTNDPVVPHQNAMLMFDALNTAKIPTELHLYEGATHGFPLKDKQGELLPWGPQALHFMQKHGLDANTGGTPS